ncbi:MAG: glycosyl hydrolase 115 family protein, partial [Pedobacter sp.]|nr:glycosyl hydrolase 115 family protein [Pedobacter sp.]
VNVGDLKPMEFPISFFLDYAWSPAAIPAEKLKQYMIDWSGRQFGGNYAAEIADILDLYAKYNGRIKPELLNENTYSLINYNELETVVGDYKKLEERARYIYGKIPVDQSAAYYQLIMHPVEASSNLHEMYYQVGKNKLYAKQGRFGANALVDTVGLLYKKDHEITNYYNKILAGGKWDHMMDQTHISYTYWQQPEKDSLPETEVLVFTGNLDKAEMGLAIEGSDSSWKGKEKVNTALPTFDYYTSRMHYIELFNKQKGTLTYTLKTPAFIKASSLKGSLSNQQKIFLTVDWTKAPAGKSSSSITVSGSDGTKINVPLLLDNRRFKDKLINAFLPQSGVISMEAPNYNKAVGSRPVQWKTLPNYGKTLGGVMPVPVTSAVQQLDTTTAHLEYAIYIHDTGTFDLNTFISPTIDFTNTDGLKFAVSIDDQTPVMVNISKDYRTETAWRKSVADNIKIFKTPLKFDNPGKHTLKYWMISPGVVLQKLVLDLGGLKPAFLGPPETFVSLIQ